MNLANFSLFLNLALFALCAVDFVHSHLVLPKFVFLVLAWSCAAAVVVLVAHALRLILPALRHVHRA